MSYQQAELQYNLSLWPFVSCEQHSLTGSAFSPPCLLLLSWNKWGNSLEVQVVVLLGSQGGLLGVSS